MRNPIANPADAKARLNELAELATAGESVVITKRGKPVVRLPRVAAMTYEPRTKAGYPGFLERRARDRGDPGTASVLSPRSFVDSVL